MARTSPSEVLSEQLVVKLDIVFQYASQAGWSRAPARNSPGDYIDAKEIFRILSALT
jgi:hypothetical protein